MSEETIIGPQRCHRCGGEYGEHDSGCTESKEHKELTRLRDELAQANQRIANGSRTVECCISVQLNLEQELAQAKADNEQFRRALGNVGEFRTHHLAETSRLTREVLELRADNERLRSGLEKARHKITTAFVGDAARISLALQAIDESLAATLAPVVPPAMHASAPPGHKCSDCTIDQEPCPTCYEAWWKKKHPHYHLIESPVVPPPSTGTYPLFKHMADEHGLTLVESELLEIMDVVVLCGTVVPLAEAEMLAFVLELALKGSGYLGGTAAEVLAAYRAKHPPAEATARMP